MKTFSQQKMVRKMKYISDQEGIMNRYMRETSNWNTHLANTKDFINNSFQDGKVKTIAVLGSGWLLDVPIKNLSERFKKVLLVDVHHPAQVVKKVEKYKNVELFETDLSGGAMAFCWELRKKKKEHFSKYVLDEFEAETPKLPWKPDAIISVNLLNQLDIIPVDFLKSKNGRFIDVEFDRFRKKIQKNHLNWLSDTPACLISDVEEENFDDKGDKTKEKLVFTKLPEAKRSQEWFWDFDHSGSYRSGKKTRMSVKAIEW